jgi:hypothetical protein
MDSENKMSNLLIDCPLRDLPILIKTPKEILFLGSGTVPIPSHWPIVPSIRFNLQTLRTRSYLNFPIWAILLNRSQSPVAKKYRDRGLVSSDTYLVSLLTHSLQDRFDLQNRQIEYGLWFNRSMGRWLDAKKQLTKRPKFSVGFYMCLWLLSPQCSTVYIAGFDGCLKRGRRDYFHADNTPACLRHDLNFEWETILECCYIAKAMGKKVFIADPAFPNASRRL